MCQCAGRVVHLGGCSAGSVFRGELGGWALEGIAVDFGGTYDRV